MTIKSFRGMMADAAIDTIHLATRDGSTGYRITKFEMMAEATGTFDHGFIIKIFKVPQTTATALVDFSDNTMLAAGYTANHESIQYANIQQIVFDNEIFNQDIYITCKDIETGQNCNYYIELEQMKLDLNENTVATLKDIRNIEASSV